MLFIFHHIQWICYPGIKIDDCSVKTLQNMKIATRWHHGGTTSLWSLQRGATIVVNLMAARRKQWNSQ